MAMTQMSAILARNPKWTQGHVQWAQLCSQAGQPGRCTETVWRALEQDSSDASLWNAAIHILTSAGRHSEAWNCADKAIAATRDRSAFELQRAAALSDAGEVVLADDAFSRLGEPANVDHAIRLARHLIRSGASHRLVKLADKWMLGGSAHLFWPYASIAWRQSNDRRWEWLEGDPRLVQVIDLSPEISEFGPLIDYLGQLHSNSGRFLDQSVRGGTQTDGPLLSRIAPEIRALRSVLVKAVEAYQAQLPPFDETHPMLRHARTGRVRFAGSWSVRLSGAGFHTAHVHPQGWISSAFYLVVPGSLGPEEGRLVLGEPPSDLSSELQPLRSIEPKPGQLVLFPSMMWHGTLPFREGERMTVAFDVAAPK
jgi:hypothetical protein